MCDEPAKIREATWTGTEEERRPQGICLPPTVKPKTTPRYAVAAGTRCTVRSLAKDKWMAYTTTRDLAFERYERYEEAADGNYYHFRLEGWIMRVGSRHVTHRNFPRS